MLKIFFYRSLSLIKKLLSVPRSLFYNIIFFGLEGIRLPVLFSNSVKIKGARRNSIILSDKTKRVKWGFGGSYEIDHYQRGLLYIGNKGTLVFKGRAILEKGTRITIENGEMTIGDNFFCNKNCCFICNHKIAIGPDAIFGWNVYIRDSDAHTLLNQNGERINPDRPVIIGKHVWIGAFAYILKGAVIKDDCVVGFRSCVTGSTISERNSVLAGVPARMIKQNINWHP